MSGDRREVDPPRETDRPEFGPPDTELSSETDPWSVAIAAGTLFAVDPTGLAGVALRAAPGPSRERWLAALRARLPPRAPVRRVPVRVGDERLLGGLALAATLAAGRPIGERGLLAEADGGVVLLAMAERMAPRTAAHLAAVLDRAEVLAEREGLSLRHPARLGVIALDEGLADGERPPAALLERLALHVDLSGVAMADLERTWPDRHAIEAARERLPGLELPEALVEALCETAAALGIASLRAPLLAARAARAAAALAARPTVAEADAVLAARLVLAPRARVDPRAAEPTSDDDQAPPCPPCFPCDDGETEAAPREESGQGGESLREVVLEAASAAIPEDLLAGLRVADRSPFRHAATAGRAGARTRHMTRGRPIGVAPGEPRAGARVSVADTLRAAAPWQRLRAQERPATTRPARLAIRPADLRFTRFQQRTASVAIFVVDASGSAALNRLAEAKGAVELLLADCYVRRERAALIAFRGEGAEVLLPPTRSLARAKRALAALPGGGGTPLAAGLDEAAALAEAIARRGETPFVVLLTDGRANVARDPGAGRAQAHADAIDAARQLRAAATASLVIDTSPRPRPAAAALAAAMAGRYLALPHADAAALSRAVRAEGAPARGAAG